MALKNRNESSVAIQAQAAIVGETEYKQNLDGDILQNAVFRKDVSDSETATGTTKTLDFLDIDYIEVAQSNNVTYTLSNIQQGEIKFLKITKTAAQTIAFAAAIDVSQRRNFITSTTIVIYRITNKDGNLYVESINIDNNIDLEPVTIDIGDWDMDTDSLKIVIFTNLSASQIKEVTAIIRNDADNTSLKLASANSATGAVRGTIGSIITSGSDVQIILHRITGEGFDNTNYSTTSYNRGTCTVWVKR